MSSSINNLPTNHLIDRYLSLIEVSRNLSSTLDLDTLLKNIVTAAAEVTYTHAASILLYDEGKNELYFQVSTNIDSPLMRGLVVPVESSIAGEIVTKRKPIVVMDVKSNPRHFDRVGKELDIQTQSLLGVPLIAKDKVIGVLEVINKIDGDCTQEDEELLGALGSQAAIAIENARLFQQSDLVSEMVHELRTPLASINTAAFLLKRPEISPDQRTQIAETIQSEAGRLSEMVSSFLDLARLESGRSQFKVKPVDLKKIITETIDIMQGTASEKGLKLEKSIQEPLPLVEGDSDKLLQVGINLVSNAIKYNRPNGKVTVGAKADKDQVYFYVADTGLGMLPEHVESLFTRFYRVPGSENVAQGTGLGLTIVKKIVEGHGGQIDVKSEVGSGTTITVILPLKKQLD
jgi:signal transduction histidine kinase